MGINDPMGRDPFANQDDDLDLDLDQQTRGAAAGNRSDDQSQPQPGSKFGDQQYNDEDMDDDSIDRLQE